MASTRSDEVAEILWELKRADKIATYSTIARRSGFNAGAKGRAMIAALKTCRRDWPHLHWWRAIPDDGVIQAGSEQALKLAEAGYTLIPHSDTREAATHASCVISVVADSSITKENLALFLKYLDLQYREIGGGGLKISSSEMAHVTVLMEIDDVQEHLMDWDLGSGQEVPDAVIA